VEQKTIENKHLTTELETEKREKEKLQKTVNEQKMKK
jgi:hypothetical protein